MSEGKSFLIHAPATGKARRPTVESLKARTDRMYCNVRCDNFKITELCHVRISEYKKENG